MTKRLMRGLVPAMAMVLAVGMTAGCSGNGNGSAGANTEEKSEGTKEAGSAETAGEAKDTLIIATANETPSVTSNEHNAVAGNYINQLTYNGLFKQDENLNPVPDLVESYERLDGSDPEIKTKQIMDLELEDLMRMKMMIYLVQCQR